MASKKHHDTSGVTDLQDAFRHITPDGDELLAQLPLTSVLEAMPDAVGVYHHSGRLIFVNSAARRLFDGGINPETMAHPLRERFERLNPRDADGAPLPPERWYVTRLLNGETIPSEYPAEMLITTVAGVERLLSVTGAPITTADGRMLGAIAVARDTTAQRLREREQVDLAHRELEARTTSQRSARELERLQVALDTALMRLSLDDLLAQLLERATSALGSDTATLLLADARGETLTVRAARGLDREIIINVRVPIGRGFAGTIAATRKSIFLRDTTHADVVSAYLREKLHSAVGVPMLVGDRLLGVLHVGSIAPREFTASDTWLLQQIAERAALVIDRAQLYDALQQTHSQVAAQARKLDSIIESLTEGVILYAPDGSTLHANSAYRQMMGISADGAQLDYAFALRGQTVEPRDSTGEPLPEEQWPAARVLRGEVIDSAHSQDVWLRAYDGRDALYSATGGPVYDDQGQFIGAVMALRDVTELRALERRTQESLEALLEMAETIVSVTTHNNDATSLRQVGKRLIELARSVLGCRRMAITLVDSETGVMRPLAVTGLKPAQERRWWAEQQAAEQRGARLDDMPDPDLAPRLRAGESVAVDLRDPRYRAVSNSYGIQTLLVAPMLIMEQLVGFISLDYDGQPHEFTPTELGLASAVSKLAALVIERERMLREQAAAEARVIALAEANLRMDEFLGIAAHELRTPITVIKANLQMLLRRAVQVAQQANTGERVVIEPHRANREAELLSRTEKSLSRLTRLVDDLLDVSRVHAGKLEMRVERISLADVTREAVEEQRLATPDRAIELDLPCNQPMLVMADAERAGQVITNYLTNALKYSNAETSVRVRLWREGAMARVSVTDQGPGIPPGELDQVWELFHRIPGIEVVSGSGIGLGLGLHLCKTLIERQGGQVGVASKPGRGSTFWFSLPLLSEADD